MLTTAQDELKNTEKDLKNLLKLAEHSWIVDTTNIKIEKELGGVDIQTAFKHELANAQKGQSQIEQILETAIDNIDHINKLIEDIKSNAKKL